MQDWLQMPPPDKDVNILGDVRSILVLVNYSTARDRRDVGQARFPGISVIARQFLAIPAASATSRRVSSFDGLTLSDLRKSLLEGTLEAIMWAKWGPSSIPLGRGDLHITHPELCD